jgi:hypothetical protein
VSLETLGSLASALPPFCADTPSRSRAGPCPVGRIGDDQPAEPGVTGGAWDECLGLDVGGELTFAGAIKRDLRAHASLAASEQAEIAGRP